MGLGGRGWSGGEDGGPIYVRLVDEVGWWG